MHAGRQQRADEVLTGAAARKAAAGTLDMDRATLKRVFLIVMFAAAVGGFIFQSTTFSLPKKDRYGFARRYLVATLRVLCGGRIAEERKTSDVSSGAEAKETTRSTFESASAKPASGGSE